METKTEIMKRLAESFDDFKNKDTGLHDLYELAYFCYMNGSKDAKKEGKE